MKVVKCLKHIPKKLWGMVLEEEHPSRSNAECDNALGYCLSDTDTFPLPEQGTKVEVSDDGTFTDFDFPIMKYLFHHKGKDRPFITFQVDEEDDYYDYKYIRPRGKEERSEFRELAERLDRVYKIVYKYVNGTNPPKTDKS